jgi:hypothetical protein
MIAGKKVLIFFIGKFKHNDCRRKRSFLKLC